MASFLHQLLAKGHCQPVEATHIPCHMATSISTENLHHSRSLSCYESPAPLSSPFILRFQGFIGLDEAQLSQSQMIGALFPSAKSPHNNTQVSV